MFFICSSLLLTSGAVWASDTTVNMLPDGIAMTVGDKQVEIRVASPHAFRLHIFHPPDRTTPSIYLSGRTQPSAGFTVIHEGAATGIQSGFGALLVNPADRTWTLRDSSGATLTKWATLGASVPEIPPQPSADGKTIKPGSPESWKLFVGELPAPAKALFYGSGNIPAKGSLTQAGVVSRALNGGAGLPQFWSSAGYGALLVGRNDNEPGSWKTETRGSISWTVPGDDADLYVMPARNLYDWLRDDAELAGFAPVPPKWTFGYLQSRWGWQNKAYIDDTFATFRKDRLPVDAFILDFEWYTTKPDYAVKVQGDPAFVDFGWNPALLPDPHTQISEFSRQGLKIVGIRKPRLGNADNLVMAREKGWILPLNPLDPNGGEIRLRNLDFARPEVRTWWAEGNRKFYEAGMAGFWNDEGEASYTGYIYWNIAEQDLLRQIDPQARFWSLNRSFIPGMQRLGAAVWTGDINADWRTLARTPGELLSYGLSGMPYSTCDIGGYSSNPTPEMLVRWMQAGVFFPVMRSHSSHSGKPRFPWLFGDDAEAAIRKALEMRYRLIPYYYSLAWQNYNTAAPIMRPLAMEFPDDTKACGLTDEWLMGAGLLAAPVLNEGGVRSVYLPNGKWFTLGKTRAKEGPADIKIKAGLADIPVYVRAGTLLPLGPVRLYSGQPSGEPLELQIYPGHDATFQFVEDDGVTLAYQNGASRVTLFSWSDRTRTLSWKITRNFDGNVFHAVKAVLFSPGVVREREGDLGSDGSLKFSRQKAR